MAAELLSPTEAARRLGISTRQIVRLMYYRRIRYAVRKGLPHVPADAIDEYRNRTP